MERRDVLKYTAMLSGAAVAGPLLSVFLSGCNTSTPTATDALHFFTADEQSLTKQIVDIILPKTDAPAASEVGVHNMIDQMVGTVFTKDQKTSFKTGFGALKKFFEENSDVAKAIANIESGGNVPTDVKDAYLGIKQQAIAYYLSSEEVGTKFLNYLPVPGPYVPCITLEEAGGKAWAL